MPTVLDVWAHVAPRFGGVGPAAAQLAAEVTKSVEWTSKQAAICGPDEDTLADGIPQCVERIPLALPRPLSDRQLRRTLYSAIVESSICHVHGLWLPHTLAARAVAWKLKKPVVSSVHGMLERWELKNKGLKKSVYSCLLERSSLAHSACLRALSNQEAEDYRRYGLKNPIAVVPNGITPQRRTDPDRLFARFPELKHRSIVLFLGRIHYKKGILNLIQAWKTVAAQDAMAHLLIAGADYESTLARVCDLVRQYDLGSSVTFAGTLSGTDKAAALSASRLFCLPSYSEGLSIALLEALSIGLPVVCSPACNMDQVEQYHAGEVVPNDPGSLSAALLKLLRTSETEWRTASENAAKLASEQFDWATSGEQMRDVYDWLLGGPKPCCVAD